MTFTHPNFFSALVFGLIAIASLVGQNDLRAQIAAEPNVGIVLNEMLASNRRGRLDERGESSDWVEIHNPSSETQHLDGYRLTDDLAVLDKWTLPNCSVAAGGYFVISMSGQDRVALSQDELLKSAGAIPFETTLINHDAKWKYVVPSAKNQDEIAGWNELDYDDGWFAVGTGSFGYGDEDDTTALPPGTTAVFIRHEFSLDGPLTSDSMVLEVDYDDGFIAFLNGVKVVSINAGAEAPGPGSVSHGSHEAGEPERYDLSQHVGQLKPGKNVLAIVGLNTHSASSDMTVKASLGVLPPVSHANFRLKKKGGTLCLVAPNGKIADKIEYPEQLEDQSLGRSDTAPAKWGYFLTPTPGAANTGQPLESPVEAKIAFSPQPGAHDSNVAVIIENLGSAKVELRFTKDGSEPKASSPMYKSPVKTEVTTVIRAAAFVGEDRASQIVSATYIVGHVPKLPVISITMKPEDFRDVHMTVSASGRGGERPGYLEIFNTKGKRNVATGFGLRLHGGAGRRGPFEKKKSYRVYFREFYGDGKVKHDIIPDANLKKFDKLVLRSSSNDGRPHGSYIRDQLVRDLHRDMGGMSSAGTWYVLFVNGQNYGVYNVVERMDEDFFTAHLGDGNYDVIKTGNTLLSGSLENWNNLRRFIESTDFSKQANFDALAKRVDIEDFTDYVIVNLWAQNFDWPHNNWYAARRVPVGKWMFLCWDAEWGFLGGPFNTPEADPYAFIDSGGAYGTNMGRSLFFALIGNLQYREYYQQRVRKHLAGALSTENVIQHVHRNRDAIQADTEHEFETRQFNLGRWRSEIAKVEDFGRGAGERFQKYTDTYFSHKPVPGSADRFALFEDANDMRHILFRDSSGDLIEIAAGTEDKSWEKHRITLANKSAGSPATYSIKDKRFVVYRDASGQIHQLWRNDDAAAGSDWSHENLSAQLSLVPAAVDPAVVVSLAVPHIVFVDRDATPQELWFEEGKWHQHPLHSGPKPFGDISVEASADELRVTYLTMYGVPCQQTLRLRESNSQRRTWLMRLNHLIPAKGLPVANTIGGARSMFFCVPEEYPQGKPFVFLHQYRGEGYKGKRNVLVRSWNDGTRFPRLDQVGEDPQSMAGDPINVVDLKNQQEYVAYRDTDGHIHEVTITDGKWDITDLTTATNAVPAGADPVVFTAAANSSRYYIYRDSEGGLHELKLSDGKWVHHVVVVNSQDRNGVD